MAAKQPNSDWQEVRIKVSPACKEALETKRDKTGHATLQGLLAPLLLAFSQDLIRIEFVDERPPKRA